ncbi:MAG: channel protein TolC, partial [Gallionella sp.]|nr:channel protein TolC [Gallionella sp.]MDP1939783.1 channel protein TolC [Gallionella sp.]
MMLLALVVSGAASGADLLDTFHSAQRNDPVFAAARAAQQAGQEKLPQGRALLMPSVNLTAN